MNYITTDHPVIEAAQHVAQKISKHLDRGEKVLWLLSGGSGIAVDVEVSKLLAGTDLTKLSVSLTDERYGPLGHTDENWQQIMTAGFAVPGATLYRPLIDKDEQTTLSAWEGWLSAAIAQAEYSIGIFGIGGDGHTAGIKPGSSAAHAIGSVAGFAGTDFQRLTITFPVIRQLSEVVIQASGDDKAAVLTQLLTSHDSLELLPAKVLTTLPVSTLYTTVTKEESL